MNCCGESGPDLSDRLWGPRKKPRERFTWTLGLILAFLLSFASMTFTAVSWSILESEYNHAVKDSYDKAFQEGVQSDPGMACISDEHAKDSEASGGSMCSEPGLLCTRNVEYSAVAAPVPAPAPAPALATAPLPALAPVSAPLPALAPISAPSSAPALVPAAASFSAKPIPLRFTSESESANFYDVLQALIASKKITQFAFSLVNGTRVNSCPAFPKGNDCISEAKSEKCSCDHQVIRDAANGTLKTVEADDVMSVWWTNLVSSSYKIDDISLLSLKPIKDASAPSGLLQIRTSNFSYLWLDLDQSRKDGYAQDSHVFTQELLKRSVDISGCPFGVSALGFSHVSSYSCASGVRIDQLGRLNDLTVVHARVQRYDVFGMDVDYDKLRSVYIAFLGAFIGVTVSTFMLLIPLIVRMCLQLCMRIEEDELKVKAELAESAADKAEEEGRKVAAAMTLQDAQRAYILAARAAAAARNLAAFRGQSTIVQNMEDDDKRTRTQRAARRASEAAAQAQRVVQALRALQAAPVPPQPQPQPQPQPPQLQRAARNRPRCAGRTL